MSTRESPLPVVVDGLRLAGGVCVPEEPRGLVVLLHGIPSIAPPDIDDEGYPGLARYFASAGWAAAWVDMRGRTRLPGFLLDKRMGPGRPGDGRRGSLDRRRIRASRRAGGLVGRRRGGGGGDTTGCPRGCSGVAGGARCVAVLRPRHRGRRDQDHRGSGDAPEPGGPSQSSRVGVGVRAGGDREGDLLSEDPGADRPRDRRRCGARRPSAAHRGSGRCAELAVLEGAPHQLRRHPPALEATLEWLGRTFR